MACQGGKAANLRVSWSVARRIRSLDARSWRATSHRPRAARIRALVGHRFDVEENADVRRISAVWDLSRSFGTFSAMTEAELLTGFISPLDYAAKVAQNREIFLL